jgi:hypothetical protein
MLPDHIKTGIEIRKEGKQFCAYFTEEGTNDHVELFKTRPFFPLIEQLVDDNRNKQYFNGHKCNISDKVNEDVVGIMKYNEVEKIEQGRERNKRNAQ